MEIKKDKSMNFSIIYAVDTSMFGDTELLTDENKENLKKQGFEIADYSQDKMKGFTLTKKIKNIDSVSSDKDLEYVPTLLQTYQEKKLAQKNKRLINFPKKVLN